MTLSGFPLREQTGLNSDVALDAIRPEFVRNGIPARGCKSDIELVRARAIEAAGNEIVARDLSFGCAQRFAIETLREPVGFEDSGCRPGVSAISIFGDLDSEFPGEGARRLGKGEAIVLHQEGDDVAAFLASEAMEDLSVWIDVEGGGFLVVKGTEPLPVATGLLQFNVARDQSDDVSPVSDFVDRGFRNPAQIRPLA